MKKTIFTFILIHGICLFVFSQNTNFGSGSGTLGTNNSNFGYQSGLSSTSTSSDNSFFGAYSASLTTTGVQNTSMGSYSMHLNTVGSNNSVFGHKALYNNVNGAYNTAFGAFSLFNNTQSNNTAVGYRALASNSIGFENSAIGANALDQNTIGLRNTAVGWHAMYLNIQGSDNVALGNYALSANLVGQSNTALGYNSLGQSVGEENTAVGRGAMSSNTTGNWNTGVGVSALSVNRTGTYNTAIGFNAQPLANNLINTSTIGSNALTSASNKIRIGNSSVTVIEGQVGFSSPSDGRFKIEIQEDVAGLEFINLLRPVSYIFDADAFDVFQGITEEGRQGILSTREKSTRQVGLIAQEVEQSIKNLGIDFSGLVRPKNDHDNYGIRYSEFVVPLIKAVQQLSAQIEAQQKTINELLLKDDSTESKPMKRQGAILYNSNPNPFSTDTQIKMRLPDNINTAVIIIYNLEGKELKTLPVNKRGETSISVSSTELSAGMYLYTLIVDGKLVDIKRMILTK
jgi:hypothetical protein